MGEGESCSALGIRLYLKCIAGTGDEIEDETHDVGDGVGGGSQTVVAHVGDEMGQRRHHSQVDDILQHRSQSAYDSESDDFAQLLSLGIIHIIYLVPDIHVAKYFKSTNYQIIVVLFISASFLSEEISQMGLLHHLGDADASGYGDEDGNEGEDNLALVPAKEGMIKLGCHRKMGWKR